MAVTNDEGRMTNAEGGKPTAEAEEEAEKEEEITRAFELERWRGVLGKLLAKNEAVMQDALWKPLFAMQWQAMAEILPADVYAAMKGEMERDSSENRRGLRWCYLALVALALCEGNREEMAAEIAEIEGKLGIEAV